MPSVCRLPERNAAHAMPQVYPVRAARAAHRTLSHGEDHAVALPERHHLRARLHARALLRQYEFAAREIAPGTESRKATCSGNTRSPYTSWCRQL